jgi:type II secretory pathway pseudopilin PulG
MSADHLALLGIGLLVVIGVMLLLLSIVVVNLMTRYERFRTELNDVLQAFHANIADINQRLTAAGYPPASAPTTRTTYPAWVPPTAANR